MVNYVQENYDGLNIFRGETTSILARECGTLELEEKREEDQGSDGKTA